MYGVPTTSGSAWVNMSRKALRARHDVLSLSDASQSQSEDDSRMTSSQSIKNWNKRILIYLC
jgi:hypothetical protein